MKLDEYINVEGAVLSGDALDLLKVVQDDDNMCLNRYIEEITQVVFYMIDQRQTPSGDDEAKFLDEYLLKLKHHRDFLITLRAQKE